MQFLVLINEKSIPKRLNYPCALLFRNSWDDYSYRTTFQVVVHLSTEDAVDLGLVKILEFGQTSGYTPMPDGIFEKLGTNYCSLSGEFEFYKKLRGLDKNIYQSILRGLRDSATNDRVRAKFEDLEGFKVSLMRFSGAERTLNEARKLFDESKRELKDKSAGFKILFKTSLADNAEPFVMEFDFRARGGLPNRINVVIGSNGTGKTKLLSNLAVVSSGYGYSEKSQHLAKRAGRFVDVLPPFKSVVVVSYSAFDTFAIPGQNQSEKEHLRRSADLFGYVYCGLREVSEKGSNLDYLLKSIGKIEEEFIVALRRVRKLGRTKVFLEVLKPLLIEPSFQDIKLTELYSSNDDDSLRQMFHGMSSGHKIVVKILADLTAHLDGNEPSLVLVDEPETHLHPPLLAALLKGIRNCLDHFDGYGVISTHSPVILQEMPSRYVRVLERLGNSTRASKLSMETFGENVGVITQEVFNLDDGSTDWHHTLRELVERHSYDEIERMFGDRLGFGARAYALNLKDELEE